MLIAKNAVFQVKGDARIRVLWYQPQVDPIWVIDLDQPKALPRAVLQAQFADWIARGEVCPQSDEALIALPRPADLSDAARILRDRNWALIQSLVQSEPAIYAATARGQLVKEVMATNGVSRQTIYFQMIRFWQRGCVPEALAGDLVKCGGRGKSKRATDAKRGRPRTLTSGVGINITEEHLQAMHVAWARASRRASRASLGEHYRWLLVTCYPQQVELTAHGDRAEVKILEPDQVPTFAQFQYHYEHQITYASRTIRRVGQRRFEKLFKHYLGNSLNEVRGPGSRYAVDATYIDCYAVSRFDRNRIVGRPVLYIVIDVFSRLIVGFYISLEPPCWMGAMAALATTVEDKVALCARFGVTIEPEEWPVAALCHKLLADRGEVMSLFGDALASALNIDVENTPPFTGAAKGVVERPFRTAHATFGPYMPGFVEKDFRERGARDYRLDGKLSIEEIARVVIFSILHTNHSERRGYEGDPEIVAANVPYVPIELWNWGLERLRCDVRQLDCDYVRLNLLPRQTVRVQRNGLKFGPALHYASAEMMAAPWYLKALERGESLEAAYNSADMSRIYVRDPLDRQHHYLCDLTPHSRRFANRSLTEIQSLRRHERENSARNLPTMLARQAGYEMDMRKIVEAGLARAAETFDPTLSDAERLRGIRENCRVEISAGRALHPLPLPGQSAGSVAQVPAVPADADRLSDLKLVEQLRQMTHGGATPL
jgi:hypothetical protein